MKTLYNQILKTEIINMQNLQINGTTDIYTMNILNNLISHSIDSKENMEQFILHDIDSELLAYKKINLWQPFKILQQQLIFKMRILKADNGNKMNTILFNKIKLIEDLDALREQMIKEGKYYQIPKFALFEVIQYGE